MLLRPTRTQKNEGEGEKSPDRSDLQFMEMGLGLPEQPNTKSSPGAFRAGSVLPPRASGGGQAPTDVFWLSPNARSAGTSLHIHLLWKDHGLTSLRNSTGSPPTEEHAPPRRDAAASLAEPQVWIVLVLHPAVV